MMSLTVEVFTRKGWQEREHSRKVCTAQDSASNITSYLFITVLFRSTPYILSVCAMANVDQFTDKAQQTLQSAVQLARDYANSQGTFK
jgi:hypothetical protein